MCHEALIKSLPPGKPCCCSHPTSCCETTKQSSLHGKVTMMW